MQESFLKVILVCFIVFLLAYAANGIYTIYTIKDSEEILNKIEANENVVYYVDGCEVSRENIVLEKYDIVYDEVNNKVLLSLNQARSVRSVVYK